jgi:multidrug efflux pump
VRPEGLEDAPQVQLDIDRDKAKALGVSFDAINTAISTSLGSAYINDFPNAGRLQRVVVQADAKVAHAAGRPAAPERPEHQGPAGAAVGLRQHPLDHRPDADGALQRLLDDAHLGRRRAGPLTGDALDEMERLAAQLPAGFAFEWTGQSREEKLSGSTVFVLLGFSLLAVFLALAALYESWSIPVSVLLVVPLGVLGALLARPCAAYPNDVYFKVGLITIIGLGGEERGADHRVRQGPAGAGQVA